MKNIKITLLILFTLTSSSSIFSINNDRIINIPEQSSVVKYSIIVEVNELDEANKEYFLTKTSKLLLDQYQVNVISAKVDGALAEFVLEGDDNLKLKEEIVVFFNANGYTVKSITIL